MKKRLVHGLNGVNQSTIHGKQGETISEKFTDMRWPASCDVMLSMWTFLVERCRFAKRCTATTTSRPSWRIGSFPSSKTNGGSPHHSQPTLEHHQGTSPTDLHLSHSLAAWGQPAAEGDRS